MTDNYQIPDIDGPSIEGLEEFRKQYHRSLFEMYKKGINEGMSLRGLDNWLKVRMDEAARNDNHEAYHAFLNVREHLQDYGYPRDGE